MGAAQPLMERATANGLSLHLIANSHGHIDHIFDDGPLMDASQAPLAIHPDDAYRLDGRNNYGYDLRPVSATRDLAEGEQVRIGDLVFDVLHTPGHSEGSVCLYEERQALLIAGDVLFAGSYGRTDLPGGNDEQMAASLARLAREIHPGSASCRGTVPRRASNESCHGCCRIAASGRLIR